jgi:HlyD family secretion protein
MKRALLFLVFVAIVGTVVYLFWREEHTRKPSTHLVLYGNVDLRQVDLAFNNNERIAEVLVQEGDRVKKGQLVAKLDTSRLEPQIAQLEAQVAAQKAVVTRLHNGSRREEIAQARAQTASQMQVVERLHNGTRPEEIAEARANLEAAKADAANLEHTYNRLKQLLQTSSGQAVSQLDVDNAKAAWDVATAKVAFNQKALDLAIAGPRKEEIAENEAKLANLKAAQDLVEAGPRQEDIAQNEAQLRSTEAQLAYLRQVLADAQLFAPTDAVVRTRVMEPGEMASPQKPVLNLAVLDPKWVRAYVAEPDLGKLHPGMAASVAVDTFPGRRFEGWIGFISPVAEFTPKEVQTEELRTSLVYEVRVFVKDPSDDLRLGMPATVTISLENSATQTAENPEVKR